MPDFSCYASKTNTAAGPTTGAPMLSLFATATSQVGIFEVNTGSSATADNSVEYGIYRGSARGTATASFTATPVDQMITQTALTTVDTTWNVTPTTTANSQVLSWGQHQRGTYRWVAYDYTKFLRTQAGTGKGLALMSIVVTSAFTGTFSILFAE
jgi:hypothetical protein